MLGYLSVDVPMDLGMCDVVEQTPFFHIVKDPLTQHRTIYFAVGQKNIIAFERAICDLQIRKEL